MDRRSFQALAKNADTPALKVRELRYASPCFADLIGIGKVLEQLKEWILGITDRVLDAGKRELEINQQRLLLKKNESDQAFIERQRASLLQRQEELHQFKIQSHRWIMT